MKTLPFLTKAASGTLAATVILAVGCGQAPDSGESSANSANIEALQKENASLKKQLADTRSRIDSFRAQLNGADAPVVDGGMSAEEIINELMDVKLTTKNRRATERRVQFLLESLMQQGDAAVPHIRAFLNKMEDVEFTVQRSEEEEGRGRGRGGDWTERLRNRGRGSSLDFEQPPSLRIGLIDILKEIGGSSAEAALGEVLSKTARGFEVAYVAKAVRGLIGPDAFRDEALAAAHELLSDPVEVPNPSSFDRNAKRYLYSVLEMYNDQTFIQSAQGLLVREDGKIDDTVLDYLDDVGKEQAMDAIYQAFSSGNVTDRGDLSDLARAGLKYTGSNPQANQMFKDIMSSDEYDVRVKWSALREMDDADDATTLQARLNLMQGIQAQEDDATDKIVQMYTRQIEAKVNGEEFDMRKEMQSLGTDFWRNAFGRGENRDRGDRGSRGDNRGENRRNQPTIVPAP
ncbi:MAG: hypothetical protein CM1200mP29_04930 [Verrucomicrobiota bacterium]|nr:MAG: hypothetical protein CM1200mP29_04930 [Verrucomicrobiota bacterium]